MYKLNRTAYPVDTAADLDALVEYWHTHETDNSLQEFLGISREEYQLWLTEGDQALLDAVRQRRPPSREGTAVFSLV